MTGFSTIMTAIAAVLFVSFPAFSQPSPMPQPPAVASPFTYADVADLATLAPLVVDARIRKATILPTERAPGIAAGMARIYVEADVVSLIRGNGPLAARIAWLVDLPRGPNGKPPKLNKKRVIAFGRAASTSQIALVAPDSQLLWDPATEALARRILNEAVRANAPARVAGIANGFHQAGALPGEGESQFFVETDKNEPVTITVLRSPGAAPRWAVAFGEIVDGNAVVPVRNTLGWYRLACGLPRTVPAAKISASDDAERAVATADYAFVLTQLGPCPRTREPMPPR